MTHEPAPGSDPADQSWIFDQDKVLPGDVVLERAEGKQSDAIARLSGGEFSHALIRVDGTDFIEAIGGGSRTIAVARVVIKDPSRWRLLRYVGARKYSRLVANQAALEARGLTFRGYNLKGALASITPVRIKDPSALFCSELVAEAFQRAQAPGFEGDTSKVTPASLEKSKAFVSIEPLPLIPAPFDLPADRSAAYAPTGMNRENQICQAAYAAVAADLAVLEPSRGPVRWPPGDIHEVINLMAFCDPALGRPVADKIHAIFEASGYYHLLDPVKAEVLSHAPTASLQVVQGWRNSFGRAAQNAETSAGYAAQRPWPLWQALAALHTRNATFFATLVARSPYPDL
ncbi:hypothetical protein [Caulobacter segnis]|uniref:hypothetical protein n=1 Tax=Caulobacter segnis TaxID=88688 RepID=UPI001CBEC2F2|nr:hypothetical protein [Caulobacter segnis]UAL10213.1 hypothetical protein K8940_20985 [Caulobacter segnis]